MNPEDKDNLLKSFESLLDKKNEIMEKKINRNTDTRFETMNSQMIKIANENEVTKQRVNTHEKRLDKIEDRNKTQDNTERNTNIIIYGVKEENYGKVLDKVVTILRSLIPEANKYFIKGMIKMAKGGWNTEAPIKVSLISTLLKNDIMRTKFKLKGSQIRITEDLTQEHRATRLKLAKYSKEEINKGNKVFMRNDTLVIQGKPWTLEQLEARENEMEMSLSETTQDKEKTTTLKRTNQAISPKTNLTTLNNIVFNKKGRFGPEKGGTSSQKNLQEYWGQTKEQKDNTPKLPPSDTANTENT